MNEENENTPEEKNTPGIIPALKQTWENAKSPIAFLAVGFIIGYYIASKSPKAVS